VDNTSQRRAVTLDFTKPELVPASSPKMQHDPIGRNTESLETKGFGTWTGTPRAVGTLS